MAPRTIHLLCAAIWTCAMAIAQTQPLLPENSVTRVSDHVYAIVGWPNVGIIVGDRATLVVDTGLGPRNGATVVREAQKLAKGSKLYLTTTHFHPEHASGDAAFPPGAILIRPAVQQEEMQAHGTEFLDMFRGRSAQFKELLQDVRLRTPDVVFDREAKLDLGAVTARLMWLGAAHTRGDEVTFVEPDSVLLPGDIVENKLVPSMPNADSSVNGWLAILDKLAPLTPRFIMPDHGALGDGSLIAKERGFLAGLQARALELKRQGTSVEEAGKLLTAEFKTRYPDWESMGPVSGVVRRVYAEPAP
ncbi:Beta-lactamase domain protein [Candidatus Sulfopaludibacter sp. SbA6]|nr:Beta-lactamase domain protein [Candidatus Sulfopaludibacter sp. SbA6]